MNEKDINKEESTEEINLDEIEFDENAINEVKKFEKALNDSTKKMIIGSAIVLGIAIAAAIILSLVL